MADRYEMRVAFNDATKDPLLEDGWEPFAVTYENGSRFFWFRKKIVDHTALNWGNYPYNIKQ